VALRTTCNQARSQVLRFGGAKYIFREARILFLLFLKQIFCEEKNFEEHKRNSGGHCPVATGLPATQCQIEDYQNKDRLSVCMILFLLLQ